MINYEAKNDDAKSYTIDRSKRNILIIGKASTPNKNKIIMKLSLKLLYANYQI